MGAAASPNVAWGKVPSSAYCSAWLIVRMRRWNDQEGILTALISRHKAKQKG